MAHITIHVLVGFVEAVHAQLWPAHAFPTCMECCRWSASSLFGNSAGSSILEARYAVITPRKADQKPRPWSCGFSMHRQVHALLQHRGARRCRLEPSRAEHLAGRVRAAVIPSLFLAGTFPKFSVNSVCFAFTFWLWGGLGGRLLSCGARCRGHPCPPDW